MALHVNPRKIHDYTVNHVKYLHVIILQTIKLCQKGKATTIERSMCTKISRTNTAGSFQFREKLISTYVIYEIINFPTPHTRLLKAKMCDKYANIIYAEVLVL